MKALNILPLAMAVLMLQATPVHAITAIVGDIDGFGIDPAGLVAPNGDAADGDGDGMLEPGEFLPDFNGDGLVNWQDRFDQRSEEERAGTDGASWTDRRILGAEGLENMRFIFTFEPPSPVAADYGADHIFTIVLGDAEPWALQIIADDTVIPLSYDEVYADGFVLRGYAVVPYALLADGELVVRLDAKPDPYSAVDYALLSMAQLDPKIEVALDIGRGKKSKPINLRGHKKLKVAILSTETFDALEVDDWTVELGDPTLSGSVVPLRATEKDVNHDGYLDLKLDFSVAELVAAGALDEDSRSVTITGKTMQGVPIIGAAVVRIVPPKKKKKRAEHDDDHHRSRPGRRDK